MRLVTKIGLIVIVNMSVRENFAIRGGRKYPIAFRQLELESMPPARRLRYPEFLVPMSGDSKVSHGFFELNLLSVCQIYPLKSAMSLVASSILFTHLAG